VLWLAPPSKQGEITNSLSLFWYPEIPIVSKS